MATASVRRAPYKDFLQPALHRRFSTTASILLAIGYLQAILLATWDSYLWSWFPIGPAGVRTFFLFICGVSIIVLRIAQYHVGLRTSDSAFHTFCREAFKLQTIETLVTYVFSGWLFSQVYLWSHPGESRLGWITYYSGDRARLNEKPLFFTYHFIIFGASEALLHLLRDNDRLSLGTAQPRDLASAQPNSHLGSNKFRQFADQLPAMLISAGTRSLVGVVLSVFVYPIFLRAFVWRSAMVFLRPFYNLPKSNIVPGSLPFNGWVLWKCLLGGFMVSFVWLAGNRAFSIFLVREPLKNGRPLTSDSRDPNGSLLNGLKSKKLSIRCFAMWELAFIARDYETSRKAIYEDIERKDGPMWSQVYSICLNDIRGIEGRIGQYGSSPAPGPAAAVRAPADEKKRSSEPPKQEPIFQSTPQKKTFRDEVEKVVSQVATSPGQASPLSPIAKKAVASAKGKILQMQREATGSDDPQSLFKTLASKLLDSAGGWPFRQEFNRRLAAVVLGTPFGEPSLYINAIDALSQLAVHSLKEDRYGNVQRDIATIIRTLTSVTKRLDMFKAQLPVHWTDVAERRDTPEVDAILEALRDGLSRLIENFGPYARDLRLSLTDMRLAKEAARVAAGDNGAGKGPEMREAR